MSEAGESDVPWRDSPAGILPRARLPALRQRMPQAMLAAAPVASGRQLARRGLRAFAAACVLAFGPWGEADAQRGAEPAATITAI